MSNIITDVKEEECKRNNISNAIVIRTTTENNDILTA
jgi:hypothetical protein